MGDTELESVTSTMSTSEGIDENTVKRGTKRDVCERLHQCLHQIAECDERQAAELLADVLREVWSDDLLRALMRRMERG